MPEQKLIAGRNIRLRYHLGFASALRLSASR